MLGVKKENNSVIYYNMKKQLNGNFLFNFLFLNIFFISYDKALQIDSNYVDAWFNKGDAFRYLG